MGQCLSVRGPQLAQMPTCTASLYQSETNQMSTITKVANELASDTFDALACAKAMIRTVRLDSNEFDLVQQACDSLNRQLDGANGTTGELACFNKTFDRWGKELASQSARQGKESQSFITHNNFVTRDGYSEENLRNEVDRHRSFVTNLGNDGAESVGLAIQTLNHVAVANGAPRIPDVSGTWRKAANPATW